MEWGRDPQSLWASTDLPASEKAKEGLRLGKSDWSRYSAESYSLSVVEPSKSIPVTGSVNPVDDSGTVCISVFARPSLPIRRTTDCERVGTLAVELALDNGWPAGLIGEDRPFLDGLLRIPLVEAIMPLDSGRRDVVAVCVRLRVSPGRMGWCCRGV